MTNGNWQDAFNERHEFDDYPEHFMTGLRNEFCAGWHAALSVCADRPEPATGLAHGGKVEAVVIYETYTGQNGWLQVSKEEYERTKEKYVHRIRTAPQAECAPREFLLGYDECGDTIWGTALQAECAPQFPHLKACSDAANLPQDDEQDPRDPQREEKK